MAFSPCQKAGGSSKTGLLNYSRQMDTGHRNETFIWGELNAKYGLTNNIDV